MPRSEDAHGQKVGVLALGRPTFDVEFARENLAAMLAVLDVAGAKLCGSQELLMDAQGTRQAMADLKNAEVDQLLVLQVTFTDAAMTMQIAAEFSQPLSIWAIPEPRLGERLRLNSFCGLNLASHALARSRRRFSWLYAAADSDGIAGELAALLGGRRSRVELEPATPENGADSNGTAIAASLAGRRIGRIGEHPEGFATCEYDADVLQQQTGVEVLEMPLDELFAAGEAASPEEAARLKTQAGELLTGLDEVDQQQLDRSLRLKLALDELRAANRIDAFAIRCWPETFTEYGGAVCAPASMLGQAGVPCACEADVYGALTQLILQEAAGDAVFLADIVDIDAEDDSAVLWHCGQAPISMAAPGSTPAATIHTNRRMPLLFEFPLREGEVTLMRVSQSRATPMMILAHGRMLDRPMAFTGTSGVVRFDMPAAKMLAGIIDSGMEHHIALAYGDHRAVLRSVAAALDMPVLELG